MDLGAQGNISLCKNFLTVFLFEPLEKQTRQSSSRGFAFQGSRAAAGVDARDRVGSWVIPGSVGRLHQAWQIRAWGEGKSFYSMGGKTLAQLIAQGGGGCLIPASVQGVISISF